MKVLHQDKDCAIFADSFLPRVVELATLSSDRQSKVAACEFLHSMVLYMLGRSTTAPGGKQQQSMERLYKRIFPVILQLSCEVEQVNSVV